MVSEATALPTEPQPLLKRSASFYFFRNDEDVKKRLEAEIKSGIEAVCCF